MTTLCMKDSTVGDTWIREACALNPVQHLGDGVFLSGPVRLEFNALFKPYKGKADPGKEARESFSIAILFPPFANTQIIEAEATRLGAAAHPDCYVGGKLYGVPIPLRDQGEKANKPAYTPGLKFMGAASASKPLVYDRPPNHETLVSEAEAWKVYSGMWVIANFRLYVPKQYKRVAAGLNGVTLFGDDTKLSSGASGPNEAAVRGSFSGIRAAGPVTVPTQQMTPQTTALVPAMSAEDFLRSQGF
jgi:hypothetical protein